MMAKTGAESHETFIPKSGGGQTLAGSSQVPHARWLEGRRESKEIAEVQGRLAERFPELDENTIAAAVRLAHSELTGGIRDYVPVLVEHNAFLPQAPAEPLPTRPIRATALHQACIHPLTRVGTGSFSADRDEYLADNAAL